MRSRMLASVVAAGGLIAGVLLVPGVVSAGPRVEIGAKDKSCVLKAQAKCTGVVAKWTVEHHGNAKKANLSKAKLHGADFRGVNLTKGKLTNTTLKHARLHDAILKKAN
nr:pentapeptide repeat-containing protein [Actinomycetes bacterium]